MSAQSLITQTLNLIESLVNEAKSMLLTPLNTCSVFIDISEIYLSDNLALITISWISYDLYISGVAVSRKTAQRIAA